VEDARLRLEQLQGELARIVVREDGQSIQAVTVSMGLAYYPAHGHNSQSLLHAADHALYRAKELGRNRIEVASETTAGEAAADWSLQTS
jgi:diguanylate cyclase (GGDEF)-like protein